MIIVNTLNMARLCANVVFLMFLDIFLFFLQIPNAEAPNLLTGIRP